MSKTRQLGLVMFASLLMSLNAQAVELQIENGQLVGARNVDVAGTFYDVQFKDGTCVEIFSGCDEKSDFAFSHPLNDATLGRLAMTALMEQVFLDGPAGNFDTNPTATAGCTDRNFCRILTPIFVTASGGLGAVWFYNENVVENSSARDVVGTGGVNPGFDSSPNPFFPDRDGAVFAIWSLSSASPVPEPETYLLFGLGLLGLVWTRRRIKTA